MLGFLLPAAISGISALWGHHKSSQPSQTAGMPSGATINDLLPYLLPLIQQASQASRQNYALQQQRYQEADPLRQSLIQMTANLLPRNVQPLNLPMAKGGQ